MPYLDDLLESTRARVTKLRDGLGRAALERRLATIEPPRGFAQALRGEGAAVIAEVKRATPRAGDLVLDLDPATLANAYRDGGAAAISVLTEPDFFKGSMDDLRAARTAGLPVLDKDFILDGLQVLESRAAGADAILVIVRILGDELAALIEEGTSLGMDVLVEVHDERDVERALAAEARLVGINQRDLATFEVDPDRTAKLAPLLPSDATVVALSGVSTREQVVELERAGADAVLVGESVVTAPDPAARVRELRGAA